MKMHRWLLLPVCALMLGAADYAREWPLALGSPDAGAYRITLDEAVYRAATDAALRDVDVVDADGQPVPAMLFAADAPAAQPGVRISLPWFPLPGSDALPNSALRVASERSTDGRVLKVEVREGIGNAAQPASNWLLDASAVSGLRAIELRFAPGADFESTVRVEGSDDLQQWRTLNAGTNVLRLTRDGRQLSQTRIVLDDSTRYLRLVPAQLGLPALEGAQGETKDQAAAIDRQWIVLDAARVSPEGKQFEFDVAGRFPFDQADIALPGNAAGSWRLDSRDASGDAPWRGQAGPWTLFKLGESERSAPQVLQSGSRDRHWRLTRGTATGAQPQLKLGWQPEVLVFVASGTPPYRLVAGSVRSKRIYAPIDDLLAQMRVRRGADWQPAEARLAGAEQAGNPEALQPRPQPRDWKHIALWALLVLAAMVVGFFALSLLRAQPPVDGGQGS